jgi:osmoprotectant transport system ATP-binding protein
MRDGRIVQEGKPLDLLTNPRDRFVNDLVGAEDVMRRLSLVPVSALLELENGKHSPDLKNEAQINAARINTGENLRNALSLLLRTGTPGLLVIHKGKPVGWITLEQIREIIGAGEGYELPAE